MWGTAQGPHVPTETVLTRKLRPARGSQNVTTLCGPRSEEEVPPSFYTVLLITPARPSLDRPKSIASKPLRGSIEVKSCGDPLLPWREVPRQGSTTDRIRLRQILGRR